MTVQEEVKVTEVVSKTSPKIKTEKVHSSVCCQHEGDPKLLVVRCLWVALPESLLSHALVPLKKISFLLSILVSSFLYPPFTFMLLLYLSLTTGARCTGPSASEKEQEEN